MFGQLRPFVKVADFEFIIEVLFFLNLAEVFILIEFLIEFIVALSSIESSFIIVFTFLDQL